MELCIQNLTKAYGTKVALENFSYTFTPGVTAVLGPNGAGKSSTIKIMSGVLTPDSGTCVINGRVPWKERTAHVQEIGVVFGQRSQLWWDVPVADSFELLRDIYRVDGAAYRKTLSRLTELLDLGELLRTPARQLSLGQRMRCEIAAALLHEPKILFLDEPTIGLDAVSKAAVRGFIRTLNKERGTTVILTTHDMQDIEALAERILLIGRGRILLDGTLDELKRRRPAQRRLTVAYGGGALPVVEGLTPLRDADGHAELLLDTGLLSVSEAVARISAQTEVKDLSVSGESVEELVVSLYREYRI